MRSLIVVLLVFSIAGCGEIYRYVVSGEVGWALKKELRDKHSKEVAIANLTKFPWDELFLFAPYTPTSEVCRTLALPASDCPSFIKSESTDDGEMLMVFRQRGSIVHTEIHSRWHGDFTPVTESPLTPATAVFVVSISGEGDWLKLSLKSTETATTSSFSGGQKLRLPVLRRLNTNVNRYAAQAITQEPTASSPHLHPS